MASCGILFRSWGLRLIIPADLQAEAVSVRGLSSAALLFLTMTRYQPGGSSEKSMILSYLTQPYLDGPNSIAANHAALRKWDRLFRRGRELGLQSPDPILLVWGLDTLGKIIHNKSPSSAFTVSTFRHRYQLDSSPTEAAVMQYCQLLTAELETLSLMGLDVRHQRVATLQAETPPKGGKATPKGGKSGSPSPLNDKGICKFFASAGGCRYGKSCIHSHATLSPSENRCFNYAAEDHSMSQCERPTAKAVAKNTTPAIPKMPNASRADPKTEPKSAPKAEAKNPNPPHPNPKAAAKPKRHPKGRKMGVSEDAEAAAVPDGEGEDGPWEGALKRMVFDGPHMLASLKGIDTSVEYGLLDGGATIA